MAERPRKTFTSHGTRTPRTPMSEMRSRQLGGEGEKTVTDQGLVATRIREMQPQRTFRDSIRSVYTQPDYMSSYRERNPFFVPSFGSPKRSGQSSPRSPSPVKTSPRKSLSPPSPKSAAMKKRQQGEEGTRRKRQTKRKQEVQIDEEQAWKDFNEQGKELIESLGAMAAGEEQLERELEKIDDMLDDLERERLRAAAKEAELAAEKAIEALHEEFNDEMAAVEEALRRAEEEEEAFEEEAEAEGQKAADAEAAQREAEQREAEARQRELEAAQREAEARLREEEQREAEARQREAEQREAEARRREEEARKREAAQRELEAAQREAEQRELEARQREAVQRALEERQREEAQRELEARQRDAAQRELEAQKKAAMAAEAEAAGRKGAAGVDDVDERGVDLDEQAEDERRTKAFPPRREMYIRPMVSRYNPNDPSLEHHGSQLLEISTRPYLYALCEKYGRKIEKLRDIPQEELDELQSLGFEWIWLMGIWQLGENCLNHDRCDHYLRDRYSNVCPGWSVEDVIGYPLCIVSYTVNQALGTEEDLAWLREEFNKRGMKLMLDFVPNHTAIDAPEFTEHPEWYLHGTFHDPKRFMSNGIAYGAGKWIPPMYFSAQLDMTNEYARRLQIENLKSIAQRCDGVRVHVAHFCLTDLFMEQWLGVVDPELRPEVEFWEEAIAEVRANSPRFLIMAETYGPEIQKKLLSLGFDYIYDKELLDDLTDSNLDRFRAVIATQDVADMEHFVHFVENHDEARAIERFFNNPKMAAAAAAALLSLPGLRLINFHQWLGYTYKIDVHLRRSLPERYLKDTVHFYTRFLRVLQTDAVRYGSWHLVEVLDATTVLAWKWVKDDQHILITINYCGCGSGGRIICEDAPQQDSPIAVKELLDNVVYERDPVELASTGLQLVLNPYQVQIFEY